MCNVRNCFLTNSNNMPLQNSQLSVAENPHISGKLITKNIFVAILNESPSLLVNSYNIFYRSMSCSCVQSDFLSPLPLSHHQAVIVFCSFAKLWALVQKQKCVEQKKSKKLNKLCLPRRPRRLRAHIENIGGMDRGENTLEIAFHETKPLRIQTGGGVPTEKKPENDTTKYNREPPNTY